MTEELQRAIETAPVGTSGLVCEPWTPGEVYGVAANWAEASCPVRVYGEDGWTYDEHGRQVANFRHGPRSALVAVLAEALRMSAEDDDEAEAEAEELADEATEF